MPPPPKFFLPDRSAMEQAAGGAEHSYAIRNYYGRGPIGWAKRQRFQRALNLAGRIPASRVVDMGTGDGVLLPTLARYYEKVLALDINPSYVEQSQQLVNHLQLTNVELVCIRDLPFHELRNRTGGEFHLMFLLETLEHVGNPLDLWGSKMSFLRDCFTLLRDDGRILVTVPKMVGKIMLFKNLLQRSLGLGHDSMTFRQLLRSSFFNNTDELEPLWAGGHVGFNHLKLEHHLQNHFTVLHREESLISAFYVLGRK